MAKIDVIMPQMGESIAEGTMTRWMKKVGDAVKRDEPIFEISTDKVDAEIPAPVAGALTEIKVTEGATVAIKTVVATPRHEPAPLPLPRRPPRDPGAGPEPAAPAASPGAAPRRPGRRPARPCPGARPKWA